jgi:hypothetical protein
MNDVQHRRLLQILKALPCSIAISGYASALYQQELSDWRLVTFDAITRGHTMRTECVWMNYPEPNQLHDYSFLGADYRQRERIKRKKARWVSRLASLPTQERYCLLSAMEEIHILPSEPVRSSTSTPEIPVLASTTSTSVTRATNPTNDDARRQLSFFSSDAGSQRRI